MRSSFVFFKIWTTIAAAVTLLVLVAVSIPVWIAGLIALLIVAIAAGFYDRFKGNGGDANTEDRKAGSRR